MSTMSTHNYTQKTQYLSPTTTSTFPILAIALVCILATALLLVIYYLHITKCFLNLQQTDPFHRPSSPITTSPATWNTFGLSQTLIRKIPTLKFTKTEGQNRALFECAVCLSEFEIDDPIRVLPKCKHGFHLDCIDVWLQSNANCPLCRGGISGRSRSFRFLTDRLMAPTSTPEDYVEIEMGGNIHRKCRHGSMMGDECVEVENVIRRSFSMDSVVDRGVYLAVRETIREGERNREEGSRSGRVRRSFFSFRRGRSRSILPIEF